MPVSFDSEMRRPSDHISERGEKLDKQASKVCFGMRLNCSHYFTRQPIEGFIRKRLGPGGSVVCNQTPPSPWRIVFVLAFPTVWSSTTRRSSSSHAASFWATCFPLGLKAASRAFRCVMWPRPEAKRSNVDVTSFARSRCLRSPAASAAARMSSSAHTLSQPFIANQPASASVGSWRAPAAGQYFASIAALAIFATHL